MGGAPKCVLRVKKLTGKNAGRIFQAAYNHNFRVSNASNADINRRGLNEELIPLPDGKTYYDVYKAKLKAAGHTPRKNAVYGVEFVLTYDSKKVPEDFDLDGWKEASVNWLKTYYPEDCMISAVLHRDEGVDNGLSAHIHAVFIPMHEGKLSCKHYFDGADKMEAMHDSYAAAVEQFGLERGQKRGHATAEQMKVFYSGITERFGEKPPEMEDGQSEEEYLESVHTWHCKVRSKDLDTINQLERKVKQLERQIQYAAVDARIDARDDNAAAKKNREEARKELERIRQIKEELDEKLVEFDSVSQQLEEWKMLQLGLQHHPDREFVAAFVQDRETLIEYGRFYANTHSEEHEDSDPHLYDDGDEYL